MDDLTQDAGGQEGHCRLAFVVILVFSRMELRGLLHKNVRNSKYIFLVCIGYPCHGQVLSILQADKARNIHLVERNKPSEDNAAINTWHSP